MAERKPQQKYFDPDFDPQRRLPKHLSKKKKNQDKSKIIRLMLPFSMTCSECNAHIGVGKKFNAHKEEAKGLDYLTIKRFRFRFKCIDCKQPITILTDPKNASYEVESGGKMNFNYTLTLKKEEANYLEKSEEKKDSIAQLEERVVQSRREISEQNELESLQMRNRIRASTSFHNYLLKNNHSDSESFDSEEEMKKLLLQKKKIVKSIQDSDVLHKSLQSSTLPILSKRTDFTVPSQIVKKRIIDNSTENFVALENRNK